MRAAILGCRHKGECGLGFMQVNSGSSCGKIWHFEHNALWNISKVDFFENSCFEIKIWYAVLIYAVSKVVAVH